MLAEFAFLPSIFDEKYHPDIASWKESLRELGREMFKRNVGCPAIVADLQNGNWSILVERNVRGISDKNVRADVMKLLTQIKEIGVRRPGHLKKLVDDDDWTHEIVLSQKSEAFDRIVTTGPASKTTTGAVLKLWNLADVSTDAFWNGISPDCSPQMKIKDQVRLLRKLCIHSAFVMLVTPHISGRERDETDFAIELVRSALDRPPGYPSVQVELHTEVSSDWKMSCGEHASSIAARVKNVLGAGQELSIVIWKKLLDRVIIAGDFTKAADGALIRRPRWGVSMNHIARRHDEIRAKFFTEWKLLNRDSVGRWFEKYCGLDALGCLHRTTVTG